MSTNWLNNLEFKKARKLYTGRARVKVIAVNPTAEEISQLRDIPLDRLKEPEYEDRIVFYLQGVDEDFIAPVSFFPSEEEVNPSKTGKINYINDKCQTAWLTNLEDVDELPWFDRQGARPSRKGEAELYQFFINWLGVNTENGSFKLPFEEFVTGDISSIKTAIETFKDDKTDMVVLLGVSQNKYQEVYNREFARGFRKDFSKISWDREYTLDFAEYIPKVQPDALESDSLDSNTKRTEDDLPF